MLLLGVSSVGATSPSSVGLINVVVVGAQASASNTANPNTTNTTYRDAVRINVGTGGGAQDGCAYNEIGDPNNEGTPAQPKPAVVSRVLNGCGGVIIAPAAYPLWENQQRGVNVLVVPPTGVPGNRTAPQKSYIIETFR